MVEWDPLSKFDDKAIFFLTAGIGAIFIAITKSILTSQIFVALIPCLFIIIYASYTLWTKRFRLREDQIGENVYYLGLLYTLTSLSVALFLYGQHPDNIDDIIANFGVALSTTIVGIAGRVLFAQMRQDPVEVEREARLELAEAASRLRDELLNSVTDINTFRRATEQSIEEARHEMTATTQKALAETVGQFKTVAETITKEVAETLGAYAANAQKLNQASGKTVTAIEKLLGRIEELTPPRDLLEVKLAPSVQKIETIIDHLAARTSSDGAQIQQLVALVENAVRTANALDQRTQAFIDRGAAAEAVANRLNAIAEGLSATSQVITQASQQALETVRGHNVGLAEELERSRQSVSQVHRSLADMTNTLATQLGAEAPAVSG
ncbi:hypothetical protein AZA_90702 [Nitrospirillum viridazoti Y2]|nr:hypothetical protein AZA_90702 [Nitrospirillum amazonense Y2]